MAPQIRCGTVGTLGPRLAKSIAQRIGADRTKRPYGARREKAMYPADLRRYRKLIADQLPWLTQAAREGDSDMATVTAREIERLARLIVKDMGCYGLAVGTRIGERYMGLLPEQR